MKPSIILPQLKIGALKMLRLPPNYTEPQSMALLPSPSLLASGPECASSFGAHSTLSDAKGRSVSYLRLSITDRCNLNCRYCRTDAYFIPHQQVMRFEEMDILVDMAVAMGIRKLRLTGGEPFVRKGFPEFLARLRQRHPKLDLRITSNGILLAPYARLLKELSVGVNVSLDSFQRDVFAKITGRDMLDRALEGIFALLHAQVPLKINAVALKGINDKELPIFLDFAKKHPVDVRFIEFMPMGENPLWTQENCWTAPEILQAASALENLVAQTSHLDTDGPAKLYKLAHGLGRLGLITPMSHHFCESCNRLRITSDGRLRTCLFDDKEYPLLPILRHPGLGMAAVCRVVKKALQRKPLGTMVLAQRSVRRSMTSIGG